MSRHHVFRGKGALTTRIKGILKEAGGSMYLDELMKKLVAMGYLPGPIRASLLSGALDLTVDPDELVRPTGGKTPGR